MKNKTTSNKQIKYRLRGYIDICHTAWQHQQQFYALHFEVCVLDELSHLPDHVGNQFLKSCCKASKGLLCQSWVGGGEWGGSTKHLF